MGLLSLDDLRRADGSRYVLSPAPAPVCGKDDFKIAATGFDHGHIGGMCQALARADLKVVGALTHLEPYEHDAGRSREDN